MNYNYINSLNLLKSDINIILRIIFLNKFVFSLTIKINKKYTYIIINIDF